MVRVVADAGKWTKLGLGALVLAAAMPVVSAYATSDDPTAKLTAEEVVKGRALFNDWSCGACHTLADGGGTGHVGPSLDGDTKLDHPFVVDRLTNGQGAMPSFGGQMTDEEISLLAKYVVQSKK
jgi:mono/diheme cytochrome c family protein